VNRVLTRDEWRGELSESVAVALMGLSAMPPTQADHIAAWYRMWERGLGGARPIAGHAGSCAKVLQATLTGQTTAACDCGAST
jgi:hypothetical protein